MDPVGDFGAYLAKIDWLLAVVAAVVAITVAAFAKRFLEPAFDQVVELSREAREALTRRLATHRPNPPTTRWTCPVCRSVNVPAAAVCYRGCGPRPEDASAMGIDDAEMAIQRGGRGARRG